MSTRTPKFLDILLNLEIQCELRTETAKNDQELKQIMKKLVWKHTKNDDAIMADHIARIIEIRPLDVMLEIGLDDVFVCMEGEKIDNILKAMGFSKDGLSRDVQQALIIGAAKTILNGYSFSQLKGFVYLVRSPQSYNQEVINAIIGLTTEGQPLLEWKSKEFPKLIKFLKESVFTIK